MSPDQYKKLLSRFVKTNFESQKEASQFFECSPTTMSLVLMGERNPTDNMLSATGYQVRETIKRQYMPIGAK